MSERDKRFYEALKADPARYAAYLERKRAERKARSGYETKRKRQWRAANPELASRIRRANHAVETALKSGRLVRPERCADCRCKGKVEAHHFKGYAPQHWLDIIWLCVFCHRKADAEKSFFEPWKL
jgi:hypothetical protein